MRHPVWRWLLGGLLFGLIGAAGTAWADRLYLKDGRTVWGEFAAEMGSYVTIFSGGRTLRFHRDEVVRIERKQTNMPDNQMPNPPAPARTPFGWATPEGPSAPPRQPGGPVYDPWDPYR